MHYKTIRRYPSKQGTGTYGSWNERCVFRKRERFLDDGALLPISSQNFTQFSAPKK
jgi:hypothetical protein